MLGMGFQADVLDPGHLGVALQPAGDPHGVVLGPLDAQRQGLEAAQHQVGLMGVHVAAEVHHEGTDPAVHLLGSADDDAAHHVGVAVEELRHRMEDHVGAEFQRPLQVRGGEGVIHHQDGTVGVGQFRHGSKVGDLHGGIGGCFHVQHAGFGTERPLDNGSVGRVDEIRRHAKPAEVFFHDQARGAVNRSRAHHVGALIQQRHIDGGHGTHPGAGGDAVEASLHLGHGTLQGPDGGVADPGVDIPVRIAGEQGSPMGGIFKGKGGTQIDGHVHRAQRVLVMAAVNLQRAEAVLRIGIHVASGDCRQGAG